jgi:hypothetical protein
MFSFGSNPVALDLLGVGLAMSIVKPTPQAVHQHSRLVIKDLAASATHSLVLAHPRAPARLSLSHNSFN